MNAPTGPIKIKIKPTNVIPIGTPIVVSQAIPQSVITLPKSEYKSPIYNELIKYPELISTPLPIIDNEFDSTFINIEPRVFIPTKIIPPILSKNIIKMSSPEEFKDTVSLPIIMRPIIIRQDKPESNGLIKLPNGTSIKPSPSNRPIQVNRDPAALALAYTSKQNAIHIISEIDENKLVPGRSSDGNIYSLPELKIIAKKLGIKTSAPKEHLIIEIKKVIADHTL
jgi:hypothetical protein